MIIYRTAFESPFPRVKEYDSKTFPDTRSAKHEPTFKFDWPTSTSKSIDRSDLQRGIVFSLKRNAKSLGIPIVLNLSLLEPLIKRSAISKARDEGRNLLIRTGTTCLAFKIFCSLNHTFRTIHIHFLQISIILYSLYIIQASHCFATFKKVAKSSLSV